MAAYVCLYPLNLRGPVHSEGSPCTTSGHYRQGVWWCHEGQAVKKDDRKFWHNFIFCRHLYAQEITKCENSAGYTLVVAIKVQEVPGDNSAVYPWTHLGGCRPKWRQAPGRVCRHFHGRQSPVWAQRITMTVLEAMKVVEAEMDLEYTIIIW